MNVISMVHKVHFIPDSMVGESSLPDFAFSANDAAEFMGVSAFDQLNCPLYRYVACGS